MDTNVHSVLAFPETEAKVLKISDRKHTDRSAFLPIHLQFQGSFKILHAGFQKPLRCPFTPCQQHDVVCVADAWHPSSSEFLVKFVQIDVREQWRKISALRGTFFCRNYNTVFHYSTLQITLDQLDYSLVFDVLSQEVEQFHMVDRVEIFGEVKNNCPCISLFRILLYLPNGILRTSSRTVAVASV